MASLITWLRARSSAAARSSPVGQYAPPAKGRRRIGQLATKKVFRSGKSKAHKLQKNANSRRRQPSGRNTVTDTFTRY
jgi:hypothetical protein